MFRRVENSQHNALMAEMAQTHAIRQSVLLLALSMTGVEFDDEAVSNVSSGVAAVAEEYGASPDDVQHVLEHLEPALYSES